MRIETVDLNFLGTEHVIASFLLLGDDSAALVETGPTTCLERLMGALKEHGVSPEDVRRVLVTHIHLDHAGASGHLAQLLPNATFYVHEVGYPHMVDPSKLLKSATRIYGERMEELWGEARAVPEERLEMLEAAGGVLAAHYTPGHAYHHLAYLEPGSGALFTGDVAGIRLPGQSYIRPPTPTPGDRYRGLVQSIGRIRQIAPESLPPTHFGRFDDVGRHLNELEQRLQAWLLFVEGRMNEGSGRDARRRRGTRGIGTLRPRRRLRDANRRPHEVRLQAPRERLASLVGCSSCAPPGPGSARGVRCSRRRSPSDGALWARAPGFLRRSGRTHLAPRKT